jgi:hypothetical protein
MAVMFETTPVCFVVTLGDRCFALGFYGPGRLIAVLSAANDG